MKATLVDVSQGDMNNGRVTFRISDDDNFWKLSKQRGDTFSIVRTHAQVVTTVAVEDLNEFAVAARNVTQRK